MDRSGINEWMFTDGINVSRDEFISHEEMNLFHINSSENGEMAGYSSIQDDGDLWDFLNCSTGSYYLETIS